MFKSIFAVKSPEPTPLLIIKKSSNDDNTFEYQTIEEALDDLENDTTVSPEKIEKLRASLKKLKNKTSIKIRNGEIVN